MDLKKKYQDYKKKRTYQRMMRRMKSRNVTRSKVLYFFVIYGSIAGFAYFIASLIFGWPKLFALSPIFVLIAAFVFHSLKKNWKLIWLYIRDMEQGRLLLYLNDRTTWSYEHKLKTVRWVYLRKSTIRNERRLYLNNKLHDGIELTANEKAEMRCKIAVCPQQMLDGFNKAILVDALIYAHRNICVLDENIREILQLTDENISKFSLQQEIRKIKGEVDTKKEKELLEIGRRKSKELNGGN